MLQLWSSVDVRFIFTLLGPVGHDVNIAPRTAAGTSTAQTKQALLLLLLLL
jgi:hypothetical protein